jgi:hypothetical protein
MKKGALKRTCICFSSSHGSSLMPIWPPDPPHEYLSAALTDVYPPDVDLGVSFSRDFYGPPFFNPTFRGRAIA